MWCKECQRGQRPNERGDCPDCGSSLGVEKVEKKEELKITEKEIIKAVEEQPKIVVKEPIVVVKDEAEPKKAKRTMSEETKAKIREALKSKKDKSVS